MAKLLENTFRHVNIALVNEMVRFSEELDIDLWDAIDCATTKPFGYMPFRPGPGVGGHCIPVDPSYLSHRVRAKLGYAFRMVELAEEINTAAPRYVATRLWGALNRAPGERQRCQGAARGRHLQAGRRRLPGEPGRPAGRAAPRLGRRRRYHDPFVPHWDANLDGRHQHRTMMTSVPDVYSAAREADIVVLMQPHSLYDLDRLAESSSLLLDTRGQLASSDSVHRL